MPNRHTTLTQFALIVAAAAPLLSAGCAQKKVAAAPPVTVAPKPDVRPMTLAPDTDATPPLETAVESPPSIPTPSTTAQVTLEPSRAVPPPHRAATAQPSSEENTEQEANNRPEPPTITPELSPSDQAAKQREIEDDSAVATHNLQIVSGRQLNATQQDIVGKVREALAQASDAGKDGDWVRAQNLAHKARSLSVDLIESL
jgi:hypothetical protein